jgi:uncharacterized protein
MKKTSDILLVIAIIVLAGCTGNKGKVYYHNNPEPLLKNAYVKLPLGSVKPLGWLKNQLEAQASGLTGNLDDFWPDLVNSAWKGGNGEAWERGPYYLDGLVPLSYILDDEKLKEKSRIWIEKIISSSNDSGWYGPSVNHDRWPLAVANKSLMQYYEATGDKRALDVLVKYFKYLHDAKPDWPDKEWRGVRAMENAVTGFWLYRQLNEKWILETLQSIHNNSFDWTSYYERFPWDSAAVSEKRIPTNYESEGLSAHVVNNAMAIKYPGLWYQVSKDVRYKNAVLEGIRKYDLYHGQAGGRFSGDEHLSGKSPSRGTELCSVVEYMFSLETLYEILGDNSLADRLESLAYNSLPGTTTPDMWAHQYDQQSNQVIVSNDKRDWSSNGNYSNIYGLSPTYGCCLSNMHQGWPKFVQSMWMATSDKGLIAATYGPSVVTAYVDNGRLAEITEETNYPFGGQISFKIGLKQRTRFPVYLRIPGWAQSASVKYKNREITAKGGETIKLNERWQNGDIITLNLPMNLRYETRFNNSVSLIRGPLYLSLRIEKEFRKTKTNHESFDYKGCTDWEIFPKSSWNYGLIFDKKNPDKSCITTENTPRTLPFADIGDIVWTADSSKFFKWKEEPPLTVKIRGMKIKDWTISNNSAADPPVSPVSPEEDPESITLVPYGCARLRITEFPVMDIEFMAVLPQRVR